MGKSLKEKMDIEAKWVEIDLDALAHKMREIR